MDPKRDPIHQLAASTAGSIGNEFLAALVRDLHDVMSVNLTMVTQALDNPPTRVRALYSWRDGSLGAPVEYDLEGTPCQFVYRGQSVLIPEELAKRFPKEPAHRRSYYGIPLRNRKLEVTGHFAVISNLEISQTERVEGIVQIFGRRVEAELQRLSDDQTRERLIQRLEQQHHSARQRSEFMSKVLGMVAHDLRNPLANVVSRSELIQAILEKPGLPEEKAALQTQIFESTSAIIRSSDRMERMIADLIDAARKETAEIRLTISTVPLSRAVNYALNLHTQAAGKKGITIETSLDGSLNIPADEDRLIEAVGNLISNAIKYSPQGSRIKVSTSNIQDGKTIEIRVADEGLGMTDHDIGAAFNAFRTLSAKPTDGESSTGLGLAIVKTITEAHGGEAIAQSAGRNRGTTMTLRLPTQTPANKNC